MSMNVPSAIVTTRIFGEMAGSTNATFEPSCEIDMPGAPAVVRRSSRRSVPSGA